MKIFPAIHPCPMCGGEAVLVFVPNNEEVIGPPGPIPWFRVRCQTKGCHVKGPRSDGYFRDEEGMKHPLTAKSGDPARRQAIERWNKRAPTPKEEPPK